ncbi:MAG: hypothetical protein ABI679_02890 [Gemmatimonadota bacterium]
MNREDDSSVSFREMSRWLVPLLMIILGVTLFFTLGRKTRTAASPIHVEEPAP